jgi:ABC-type uncharacterized transport system permease subunit
MNTLVGTTFDVWLGVTVVIMGFAAFMTGHALAQTWRPRWQVVIYCLLLGVVDRFLIWGLFRGAPWLASGYAIDAAVLIGFGLLSYRLTETRKMVTQYPWLYERAGPLSWRARSEAGEQK